MARTVSVGPYRLSCRGWTTVRGVVVLLLQTARHLYNRRLIPDKPTMTSSPSAIDAYSPRQTSSCVQTTYYNIAARWKLHPDAICSEELSTVKTDAFVISLNNLLNCSGDWKIFTDVTGAIGLILAWNKTCDIIQDGVGLHSVCFLVRPSFWCIQAFST